jgi:lauroyl/myristoyl acyltransferase
VGSEESSYRFFEMAKAAMKTIANLASNCRANVVKVSR